MLFDKILEFLLRSRLGNLVLAVGFVASSFLFGGCLVPDLCSCACEGAGCTELASCWSECDKNCNDCGNGCGGGDCALNGCLYGDGCVVGCGDCVTDCGGCNRTFFTDCDAGCTDDCGVSCFNCTTSCDGSYSTSNHDVRLIFKDQFGETVRESYVTFRKRDKVTKVDPYMDGVFYSFEGYYTDEAMTNQCTDNEGNWLGEDNVNSFDVLYGKLIERYAGDSRTIHFQIELPGYSIGDVNLTVGGNITNFANPPTIPGYTFRYWLLATGETIEHVDLNERFHLKDWCLPEDVENPIIEVIAVYEPVKIELTVHFDSGVLITMEFDYDTTLKEAEDALRLSYGYLFGNDERELVGWSLREDATWRDRLLSEDERFTENCAIYAVYKNYVTVHLHNFEGPNEGIHDERYLEGDAVSLPDPEPSGPYYFDGWYTNSGLTSRVTGKYVVGSEEADLYAKWNTQTTYTITYHIESTDSGWTGKYSMSDQPYQLDDADEKTGYIFEGWCKNVTLDDEPMKQLPPNTYGDFDLYAKYTPKTYTVRLTAGTEATVEPKQKDVTYGKKYQLPVPHRENYDFEGWFLGNKQITDSQGNSLSEFTEDALGIKLTDSFVQLVARWSEHQYLIQFMVEGNSQPYASVRRKSGETIGSIPELQTNPVKRGYEFEGWYCGDELLNTGHRVTGDRTYTARFRAKVYTVKLNAEGGNLAEQTVHITFGEVTTLPVPTWNDGTKTFLGWFDREGNQLTFEDGELRSPFDYDDPNLELYAHWA